MLLEQYNQKARWEPAPRQQLAGGTGGCSSHPIPPRTCRSLPSGLLSPGPSQHPAPCLLSLCSTACAHEEFMGEAGAPPVQAQSTDRWAPKLLYLIPHLSRTLLYSSAWATEVINHPGLGKKGCLSYNIYPTNTMAHSPQT